MQPADGVEATSVVAVSASRSKPAAVPASYSGREITEVGGLMSYGANITDATGSFGCDLSHAVSFQREPVSVVHKAVEDGIGDGGIADHLVPMINR